jgi:hypothetical protein
MTKPTRCLYARCFEAFGVGYPALCMLVAVVARWRCGQLLTSRPDVARFLHEEAGANFRCGPELRELERLRLVRAAGRRANTVYYAPTSTGLAKVGWAGVADERRSA